MRHLSASEAITPAIHRTKAVLFEPFQWRRSGKLAITANLSALGVFFVPIRFFSFFARASPASPQGSGPLILTRRLNLQSRLCPAFSKVSVPTAE